MEFPMELNMKVLVYLHINSDLPIRLLKNGWNSLIFHPQIKILIHLRPFFRDPMANSEIVQNI